MKLENSKPNLKYIKMSLQTSTPWFFHNISTYIQKKKELVGFENSNHKALLKVEL